MIQIHIPVENCCKRGYGNQNMIVYFNTQEPNTTQVDYYTNEYDININLIVGVLGNIHLGRDDTILFSRNDASLP